MSGHNRTGLWMQTYTGVQFWPQDPRPSEVRLKDIAHSLSLQCRYAGHCREFYSVAQHSVAVSYVVPPQDAAWGLLHDASEAYLVDLPRPVKYGNEMGRLYQDMEEKLMAVIARKFGLSTTEPTSIKDADNAVLLAEKRDIMGREPAPWSVPGEADVWICIPQRPLVAKAAFLSRAAQLGLL